MPHNEVKDAQRALAECDALLIIAGAGMSVDSGILTYCGTNGHWSRSIQIGSEMYRYDEISSLKMWKEYHELAWGFKANFYNMMRGAESHAGYYKLLDYVTNRKKTTIILFAPLILTSISNAPGRFDKDKIYEVHGTMKMLQCMDKKCATRNGAIECTESHIPTVATGP